MPKKSPISVLGFLLFSLFLATSAKASPPTVAEAKKFMENAETKLLDLMIEGQRAAWVKSNFITDDTELIEAQSREKLIAAVAELGHAARRFEKLKLPPELARKFYLLRTNPPTDPPIVAPRDSKKQKELSEISGWMEGVYGKGKYCPPGKKPEDCLDLTKISRILRESRDPDELLKVWVGWHGISPEMRPKYARFVELANEGARELGFSDLGTLWRSPYNMSPKEFAAEVDRLWEQVKPLYVPLHCYVRTQLTKKYGEKVVPPGKPIPAHLLGNMWAQEWGNIYDLVKPESGTQDVDIAGLLKKNKVDELQMVRYGEGFFTSLGLDPLPKTFWERSLFMKPKDRDVVCHASAWDIDFKDDVRLKMCIEKTGESFQTIHHELGHNFYQRAYKAQSALFADSANDGFHEGLGDTIALSITPDYLKKIGLLDEIPPAEADLSGLLRMALDKVAFLPFGLLVDQWRWKVFSHEIPPSKYNEGWWNLRTKYQGVSAPTVRTEKDFDPGAKYHIPANVPYTRYFLARILQFQFHRALCKAAGWTGPLNRCSIYGNKAAGERLIQMMEMGRSRPWPEALKALSGETQMDATAIRDYFAPLSAWLEEQNKGQTCGW